MNGLFNLSLSKKLYALVVFVIVTMGALVAYTTHQIGLGTKTLAYTVDNRIVPAHSMSQIDGLFLAIRDATLAVSDGKKPAEQGAAELEPLIRRINGQWDAYSEEIQDPSERKLADSTKAVMDVALADSEEALKRFRANDLKGFTEWRASNLRPSLKNASEKLVNLGEILVDQGRTDKRQAQEQYARTLKIVIASIIAALAASLAAAFLVIHGTMRQLGSDPKVARAIAARIASNDLDFEIPAEQGADESLVGAMRKMKESLLHSKLYYEGQITSISATQAVAEFTPQGDIDSTNQIFLKTLGYALADLRGKPYAQLLDRAERDAPEHRALWEKLGRAESVVGQFRLANSAGGEVWLQGIFSPILDASGRPFRVVLYATDVTAERAAAQMNAAFKGALNTLSSAVIVADKDFKVIYLNESGKSLLARCEADFRRTCRNSRPPASWGGRWRRCTRTPAPSDSSWSS